VPTRRTGLVLGKANEPYEFTTVPQTRHYDDICEKIIFQQLTGCCMRPGMTMMLE